MFWIWSVKSFYGSHSAYYIILFENIYFIMVVTISVHIIWAYQLEEVPHLNHNSYYKITFVLGKKQLFYVYANSKDAGQSVHKLIKLHTADT